MACNTEGCNVQLGLGFTGMSWLLATALASPGLHRWSES